MFYLHRLKNYLHKCYDVHYHVIVQRFTLQPATKVQMYSPTISFTSVLDAGGWLTPRPGRFTPGKDPVPIV
jgi:hypothetical protein